MSPLQLPNQLACGCAAILPTSAASAGEDFAFVQKVYAALYPANPAFTSADVLEVTKGEAPRGREG